MWTASFHFVLQPWVSSNGKFQAALCRPHRRHLAPARSCRRRLQILPRRQAQSFRDELFMLSSLDPAVDNLESKQQWMPMVEVLPLPRFSLPPFINLLPRAPIGQVPEAWPSKLNL